MKTSRRSFFATLFAAAGATAIAATAPVKRKTTGGLFDPHDDLYAQYHGRTLKPLTKVAESASSAEYQRSFERAMARFEAEERIPRRKIGDTITIKRPIQFDSSRLENKARDFGYHCGLIGERSKLPTDLAGYEKFFAKGFKSGSDPKTRACIGESNIDKIRAAGFSECNYWVNLDGWSKLVHSQDLQVGDVFTMAGVYR